MEKNTKPVKRDFYKALIVMAENGVDFGTITAEQMKAFAEHEVELLDKKKASAKANPNSKTTANDELREKILNKLGENPNRLYTITDMQKEFEEGTEFLIDEDNPKFSRTFRYWRFVGVSDWPPAAGGRYWASGRLAEITLMGKEVEE